jgi:hypothetical protein
MAEAAPLMREEVCTSSGTIAWSTALIQFKHCKKLEAFPAAALVV